MSAFFLKRRLRTSSTKKQHDEQGNDHESKLNVNEEYISALRTKSYMDFFSKAQILSTGNPFPTVIAGDAAVETLLVPDQCEVACILAAATTLDDAPPTSGLKSLLVSYFATSAEASKICTHLLQSISLSHATYNLIQRTLDDIAGADLATCLADIERQASAANPFASPTQHDFKLIHDQYSSIARNLNLKRKKVARLLKLVAGVKKASGVCLVTVCGAIALIAIVVAAHSLSGLVLGPALLGFSPATLIKRKLSGIDAFFKGSFLRRLAVQLDAAAKGAYILSRDFDTVGRLVDRLRDEVEHGKGTVRLCVELIARDRFAARDVVEELRKAGKGQMKQVEELEEQVCLCLATINRARVLVMKEIMCGTSV